MPLPLIIPVVAGAASLASQGYSLYNQNEAQKKQDAYEKRVKAQMEREARRQALLRILNSQLQFKQPVFESAPDLGKYAIRSGIANLISSAAGSAASMGGSSDSSGKTSK